MLTATAEQKHQEAVVAVTVQRCEPRAEHHRERTTE